MRLSQSIIAFKSYSNGQFEHKSAMLILPQNHHFMTNKTKYLASGMNGLYIFFWANKYIFYKYPSLITKCNQGKQTLERQVRSLY